MSVEDSGGDYALFVADIAGTLIFSIEGFANSVEIMHKALQGLIEAGTVTRTQPRSVTTTDPALGKAARPLGTVENSRPPSRSPNFP